MEYDFSGWATRNNIKCSDGRTILKDAFKENDGQKVPLVWNHQHDNPTEVLGHAILENRDDGVYAYCKFNNTESGNIAKELVNNGDVNQLSIYANKLKTRMNNVMHGCIREVSLVLAGANPGAYIDSIIVHSEESGEFEEAIIYNEGGLDLSHSEEELEENNEPDETIVEEETVEEETFEEKSVEEKPVEEKPVEETVEHSDSTEKTDKEDNMENEENKTTEENKEKTVGEIFESLTDEQKDAVYVLVGQAVEDAQKDLVKEEGEEEMKHNVFENEENKEVLQHSEILADAISDAKRYGSLKESVLEHAAINNITDIDKLFPEPTAVNKDPIMIERDNSWVAKVMNKTKHTPFSRVKSTLGRMTEPQARAKGYVRGNQKVDIQMAALNRITSPTTVYIKNEIDRDDVIDITDFDVVAWQKREMRKELDKELARAFLLGDGRDVSDPNKINELNIIPVAKDNSTYTITYTVTDGTDYDSTKTNDSFEKGIIRAALKARKGYQGSGKPTFFTTEDYLTDLLLIEDTNGRRIYNSENDLALALRVDEIVTVPAMEESPYADIVGIIVNMADYTAGADKGGSVNMFDDFDIDYNQMKYLMETRCSGALVQPHSAIVLKKVVNNQEGAEG
jgi:HK97 family phage prohead protease